MPQPPKYIAVENSELYGLTRKRDLAAILGVPLSDLKSLILDANYEEWIKKTPGKKDRVIEEPLPPLAAALSRLHLALRKIETPAYLMSGKRTIKPRDNAEIHRFGKHMINVDIESFYQSTKREFVYTFFRKLFKQSDDVASILANLVTYKGHIPTGTATSQLMAFWAYKQTFDRINKLAISKGVTMSVWVDDITFSSQTAFPKGWVRDIDKIMAGVDLFLKRKKTKKFNASEFKAATGSAISPAGVITVKNAKRKEIVDLLKGKRVEELSLKDLRVLMGKLTSQRQNEDSFFDGVHGRCRKRLSLLEKRERRKARV